MRLAGIMLAKFRRLLDFQLSIAELIGIGLLTLEIAAAILMVVRPWSARLSAVGSGRRGVEPR